jgi:hypothetical protein
MNESRFTGSSWALAGWYFLLLLSAYLIIPIAWVIPKYAKWYYSNTYIDGKQLRFDYDGPWWGYLGWILFGAITLYIGFPYAMKRMIQWEASHIHVIDDEGNVSEFDGTAWGLLGWGALSFVGILFFMIPIVFITPKFNKWFRSHQVISGKKLRFDYDGPWWGQLGWVLFSYITLYIGLFYAQKRMIQWGVKHTHFIDTEI